MKITKLEHMLEALQGKTKKRLVAAYANDSHTIGAVGSAIDKGIVEGILVGDEATIKKVCIEENIDVKKFRIVQETDEQKAASKAVDMINAGEADILMKGLVSTDKYMRAILNKERGLMPPKAILSHVAVMEVNSYHKLIIASDMAIIPQPELSQKVAITNYVINTAHALGIEKPRIALIAATEQMSPGMQACVDAAIIAKMADRGQIKGAVVDGPLALDVAIDKESAEIKKLTSEVAGNADALVFPNIESGNVFYKTCTKFCGSELAAMVVGAKVPCILSSRGDSTLTKLYSIALAAICAK
ncbi:MAG: bifunctional enoyl-CoA hydratase/phosphate acetyltransferase [Bacteroidales bacterium]|jgi:phosphate butyryltransferase|nr:bifunctional enoyl-CoA hydratase/phosphate acetyltransferase [Bacteroidales bacterium]